MNIAQVRSLVVVALVATMPVTGTAAELLTPADGLPPIVDGHGDTPSPLPLAVAQAAQPLMYPQPASYAPQPAGFVQPAVGGMFAPGGVVPAGHAGCAGCAGGQGCGADCGSGGPGGLGWGGDGYALGHFAGYAGKHTGQHYGPFGSGDCCSPRWFDVHAEWLYWQRDEISRTVDFTSDGIAGPIVLSTNDLSFQEESGFRITGAYVVAPSTNLEVSYFGTFTWADAAQVTSDTDNLYSVFSEFGTLPFNGFLETDEANLHRIEYQTQLNNGELNLRHRWISADCLVHGSWLGGVRYLRLSERFRHFTQSTLNDGELDYLVTTKSNLVGVQLGGDAYVCISPRFKLGVEAEAGLYGVRSKQRTDITSTTIDPPLREAVENDDVAFIGEAGFIALFRITPRLKMRGGYQVLYLNGVALAAENFNPTPPFFGRTPFLNDNGEALYHGATLGFEWTW